MDSRVIVLRGWKIPSEEYYKLIELNSDYEDYAHSACWDDCDYVFIGDEICCIDQGYYMEMDDTNRLIFTDALILTGGITEPITDINNEFLIDCANLGFCQDHEVFGPPKTYLIHSVMI